MSYSLWAVNGHANTVYNRLKTAKASQTVINQCMGECLVWKAMAYFYLVRTFGAVPIIHDNTAELAGGSYNTKFKVQAADVYEYIIMTLEKAIELLPAKGDLGRIDPNTGKSPLTIGKLQVFNPAVGVSLKKTVLLPGEQTRLTITLTRKGLNKKKHLRILMITNDPVQPKVEINLKAN